MSYASEHRSALADIRAAGAAITFTLTKPGTHNPATGSAGASSTVSVSGFAIEVKKLSERDHRAYQHASLTPGEAPMLLFAASTFGDVPPLDSKCNWGGVDYHVRAFGDRVAPDGTPILTRPIIARA